MTRGKMIAVANMKGGVGKTTTVVSLAETLAADNKDASVLVIDLDPQASASVCLAGEERLERLIREGRTIDAFVAQLLIKKKHAKIAGKIRPAVSSTMHRGEQLRISLLPCGPHLRLVEREVIYQLTAEKMNMRDVDKRTAHLVEEEFLPLREQFDFVIVDCPPGISPLTEAAIRLSDLVVVPTVPDFISVYGLDAFHQILWAEEAPTLPRPARKPHVLITRWHKGVKQHKDVIESLEAAANASDAGLHLLNTRIPQAAALAAALAQTDVLAFKQKYGELTGVLGELARELKGILNAG